MSRAPRENGHGRTVRWAAWLAAGVLGGLLFGFAFGLAKPRVHPSRSQA